MQTRRDHSCRTVAYGSSPDQVGDLYRPDTCPEGHQFPVICLLHGGFWRLPYGREHIAPIAIDLMQRGFAVWNLDYRRVGTPGGGWPGTLEDVGSGIDHLISLANEGDIDTDRVIVVGHSAGGHLALWSAYRAVAAGGYQSRRIRPLAAAGLAPVADLELAYALRCGNGAVENFLGGTPADCPRRYREASPAALLPLGVEQLLIHGTHDEDVPVEISRRYAAAALAAGDPVSLVELPKASHMDCVDPASAVNAALCRWLATLKA